MQSHSLQERFAPNNACFGCGPANERGLRIRSTPLDEESDELICEWTAAPHHQAFEGVLNGGIVGTLLDCHSNWAACWHLMRRDALAVPPCTVTYQFEIKLLRPTPIGHPVELRAEAVSSEGRWVTVAASLRSAGEITATCGGRFVAVEPGHPAYHRW